MDFCGKGMTGAGLALFMLTSFWSNKYVDGEMCAGSAVISFKAAWVAHAAFRIVHKTEERPRTVFRAIPVSIDAELIGQIFGAQALTCFFCDDGEAVLIQEKHYAL